jgi:hypothetical protein
MGKAYCTNGREEKCKTFVGKLERKRSLVKPKCRGEDNITMDLKEISWKALAQDRDK